MNHHMTPAEMWAGRLEMAGVRMGTRPGPRAGGEWDAWRALPLRTRRRLIGLGWASPRGYAPDVAVRMLGLDMSPCELIDELVRASRTAPEWRNQRRRMTSQKREMTWTS